MSKFGWFVLGLFIGVTLEFNYAIRALDYRISFYGYTKVGDNVFPVITLRKKFKNSSISFHPKDRLYEGSQITFVMDKTMNFSDEDFNNAVKGVK